MWPLRSLVKNFLHCLLTKLNHPIDSIDFIPVWLCTTPHIMNSNNRSQAWSSMRVDDQTELLGVKQELQVVSWACVVNHIIIEACKACALYINHTDKYLSICLITIFWQPVSCTDGVPPNRSVKQMFWDSSTRAWSMRATGYSAVKRGWYAALVRRVVCNYWGIPITCNHDLVPLVSNPLCAWPYPV